MVNKALLVTLVISCIFTSSCSINKISEDSDHLQTSGNELDRLPRQPCVYKEVKGVGEVIKIDRQFIYFKFYPGDETIAVNLKAIANVEYLSVGDELMAKKKFLVSGNSNECLSVELIVKYP